MSDDILKELLNSDAETTAPAFDMRFTLDVMARVERQKLRENLVALAVTGIVACLLLAVVMPYLTGPLVALGKDLLPVVVILAAVGTLAFCGRQVLSGLGIGGMKA